MTLRRGRRLPRAVITLSHDCQLRFICETPATPAIDNLHPAEMLGEIILHVHMRNTVYIDRASTLSLTAQCGPTRMCTVDRTAHKITSP